MIFCNFWGTTRLNFGTTSVQRFLAYLLLYIMMVILETLQIIIPIIDGTSKGASINLLKNTEKNKELQNITSFVCCI